MSNDHGQRHTQGCFYVSRRCSSPRNCWL